MEDNEQGLGKSVLDVFDKRSYPKHYLHQRASLYESGTQNTLEKIDWNHATTNEYRMIGGAINHCNAPTFIRIIAILLAAVVREPNRMQGIEGHLFLYDFFNREELEQELLETHVKIMRDDEKEAILMWGDWMRQNAKMLFLKSDEADKMHRGIQTIFQI